ncbi:MAG TPA: tRNA pseudouridine(38-40) synthase TruA [Chroococcales cyanobacterium]
MNLALLLAFDGTRFNGSQRQPKKRTVQGELETAIGRITDRSPDEIGLKLAGRTDAGVHARGMVVNFATERERVNWVKALNSLLPPDIAIISAMEVPENFHSRYRAIGRTYQYRVLNRETPDPLGRLYKYHLPGELDKETMKRAWSRLLGKNDFAAFCSTGSPPRSTLCTVTRAELEEEGNELVFSISAQSFLYHMVRRLVGSILEVGKGRMEESHFFSLLGGRGKSGPTAPPEGLTLMEVSYPSPWGWDSSF